MRGNLSLLGLGLAAALALAMPAAASINYNASKSNTVSAHMTAHCRPHRGRTCRHHPPSHAVNYNSSKSNSGNRTDQGGKGHASGGNR